MVGSGIRDWGLWLGFGIWIGDWDIVFAFALVFVFAFAFAFVCLSVCLSVCLFVCCLSVCQSESVRVSQSHVPQPFGLKPSGLVRHLVAMADEEEEWLLELCRQPPAATAPSPTTPSGDRVDAAFGQPPAATAPSSTTPIVDNPQRRPHQCERRARQETSCVRGLGDNLSDDAVTRRSSGSSGDGLAAPLSILAIKHERLQREAVAEQQAAQRQRAKWDREMGRLQRCSPESRRSGRRRSEADPQRCSSRSRSPHVCERRASEETSDLWRIRWEFYSGQHCGELDATLETFESVAANAETAIRNFRPEHSRSEGPLFYVGVSRYVRRRWLGGEGLLPEDAHSQKWERMVLLSTHSSGVGKAEDKLINMLRERFGDQHCVNVRGGGGGASPYKPSLLYICLGRLL